MRYAQPRQQPGEAQGVFEGPHRRRGCAQQPSAPRDPGEQVRCMLESRAGHQGQAWKAPTGVLKRSGVEPRAQPAGDADRVDG
jgi:hypothetical protein